MNCNAIVSKALRKDRERRYQLMKELRLDLESLREEAFPRQHASSDDACARQRFDTFDATAGHHHWRCPRRHRRALVGAATVLGVAILAGLAGGSGSLIVRSEPESHARSTVTRLTANPADLSVSSARISPDGKYVA